MVWALSFFSLLGIGLMFYRREWIIYILAASLPFEILPAIDLAGVTLRVSNILFLAAFILVIIDSIKRKKKIFLKSDWFLLGYLMIGGISLFSAIDLKRGFVSLASTGYVICIYFEKAIIVLTGVISIFGLFQFLGEVFGLSHSLTLSRPQYQLQVFGFPRIHSTMYEPLFLANFLIIPLVIMLVKIIFAKARGRIYHSALLLLALVVFILTLSRGGYIGLILSVLVLIVIIWQRLTLKIVVLTGSICIIAAGISLALVDFSGWYYPKYAVKTTVSGEKPVEKETTKFFINHSKDKSDGSVQERLGRNEAAIDMWKKSPIIGVGPGNYGPYAFTNYSSGEYQRTVMNLYLETLAETGILGLGILSAFFVSLFIKGFTVFRKIKTNERYILGGLLAALLGILVQAWSFSPIYVAHIWFLLGWIAGLSEISYEQNKK
jgi:O-antigen ligase